MFPGEEAGVVGGGEESRVGKTLALIDTHSPHPPSLSSSHVLLVSRFLYLRFFFPSPPLFCLSTALLIS